MNPKPKKTVLILIIVILVIFGTIGLVTILLARSSEKSNFEISPISQAETQPPPGLLATDTNFIQLIDPATGHPISSITITENDLKNSESTSSSEVVYRASPDGRYLAVLSPEVSHINYSDNNNQKSTITLYELATGKAYKFVTADDKTVIASLAWDWSSQAIGFISAKKVNYSSISNPMTEFLPVSGETGNKLYLNRVELLSGAIVSQKYPITSSRYYNNNFLLALDGNTYYLFDKNQLISINDKTIKKIQDSNESSSSENLHVSLDYKVVAFSNHEQISIYDLSQRRKQVFQVNANDASIARIQGLAISPDHNGIAFIKASPAAGATAYQEQKTTQEVLWYYSFIDKQFKQINARLLSGKDYTYDDKSSIIFAPDNNQLAVISSQNSTSTPIAVQTLKIFNLRDDSSQQYPITFTTSKVQMIHWQ